MVDHTSSALSFFIFPAPDFLDYEGLMPRVAQQPLFRGFLYSERLSDQMKFFLGSDRVKHLKFSFDSTTHEFPQLIADGVDRAGSFGLPKLRYGSMISAKLRIYQVPESQGVLQR